MPVLEDEHGTYIMNSKDLRAVEHVERLVKIGIDSLKVEGRTKSIYYVARTAQVYRQAINDAVKGRPFNLELLGALDALANRGYTDGFYERHHTHEQQNYMRGHSESFRQQYVGDILACANGMAGIDVKNKFQVGDKLEIIHPAGNHIVQLTEMRDDKGDTITGCRRDACTTTGLHNSGITEWHEDKLFRGMVQIGALPGGTTL